MVLESIFLSIWKKINKNKVLKVDGFTFLAFLMDMEVFVVNKLGG